MKQRGGFDLFDWARRHPFFIGSLALHLALLAGLYFAGLYSLQQQRQVRAQARVGTVLEAARREQMQRHLKRLETLARELDGGAEAPAAAASEPLQRAQDLAARIEQAEQRARAARLAKLLKISPEKALAQVKADDAKKPVPALPSDPARALAQLDQRARVAADRLREQARRDAEGRPVRSAAAGSPAQADSGGAGHGAGGAGVGASVGVGKSGRSGTGTGSGRPGGEATASIGGRGEPDRQYEAMLSAPPLERPRSDLRFAEGRSFGPGARYANVVYLDRWNVVGPFAAASSRALDEVLAPEYAVDLDAIYQGKQGVVGWQAQHSPTYPFIPEPREPDAIYYASTELRVDRDTEVWLNLGADDDAKLWLNDQLIWVSGRGDKPWYRRPFYRLDDELAVYGLTEDRVRVTLRAGRNTLLFKLYNGVDLMFFSVVVAR